MKYRKRNPLQARGHIHAPSHTAPSMADLEKMMEDADEVAATAGQWLARWHGYGQSHWLGGDLKHGKTWQPSPRVRAAFAKMSEAAKAAQSASHELIMLYSEIGLKGNPRRSHR